MFSTASIAAMVMEFLTRELYGTKIQIRNADFYINATNLSSSYKAATGKVKSLGKWLKLKKTQRDIKYFQSLHSNTSTAVVQALEVLEESPNHGGGVLLHPQLAVHFALWLSPEFGYQVEEWYQESTLNQPAAREMSQMDILQLVAEKALAVERRQKELELRLSKLEAEKQAALEQLHNLSKPQLQAEKISTRSLINKAVREYVGAHGISYSKVWRSLYSDFLYIYHYDALKRASNQQTKPLEQIEKDGKLEEFYALICDKLNPNLTQQNPVDNLSNIA